MLIGLSSWFDNKSLYSCEDASAWWSTIIENNCKSSLSDIFSQVEKLCRWFVVTVTPAGVVFVQLKTSSFSHERKHPPSQVEAILDEDYFLREIQRCEQNLKQMWEKGDLQKLLETDTKRDWERFLAEQICLAGLGHETAANCRFFRSKGPLDLITLL